MSEPCEHCGETYAYSVVAEGDLESSFDFEVEWRGLRLLCPGCGELNRISLGPLRLTNETPPGWPRWLRVHARVGVEAQPALAPPTR